MWSYANQLTLLRLALTPLFVVLVIYGYPRAATLLFLFAAVTDGLDGLLARTLKQKTVLGSYLDPMADKILLTAAFVTMTLPAAPLVLHIPAWLTIVTISRDVLIALSVLIIHLQTGHKSFPPTMLGKATTAAQLATVGTCMAANFVSGLDVILFPVVVYATLFLTVASGLHYCYRSVGIVESYQRTVPADGQKRHQNSGR